MQALPAKPGKDRGQQRSSEDQKHAPSQPRNSTVRSNPPPETRSMTNSRLLCWGAKGYVAAERKRPTILKATPLVRWPLSCASLAAARPNRPETAAAGRGCSVRPRAAHLRGHSMILHRREHPRPGNPACRWQGIVPHRGARPDVPIFGCLAGCVNGWPRRPCAVQLPPACWRERRPYRSSILRQAGLMASRTAFRAASRLSWF